MLRPARRPLQRPVLRVLALRPMASAWVPRSCFTHHGLRGATCGPRRRMPSPSCERTAPQHCTCSPLPAPPAPLGDDRCFAATVRGEDRRLAWYYNDRGWPFVEDCVSNARIAAPGSRIEFNGEEFRVHISLNTQVNCSRIEIRGILGNSKVPQTKTNIIHIMNTYKMHMLNCYVFAMLATSPAPTTEAAEVVDSIIGAGEAAGMAET